VTGSTLVVTGGARGIGRGIAAAFRRRGWAVVVADSDADATLETAAELGAGHTVVDVRDATALRSALDAVAARYGGIDALVTAAGITRIGESAWLAATDWRTVIDVDLSGTFYSCQAAYPHLPDGGAVVTISSVAAYRGIARRAAYCAAKAGVVALTRTLATEWAPRGIRVNGVAPGWVDTPFLREAVRRGDVDLDELARRPPLGGLTAISDVVGAVTFLVSEESRFVTGQTLVVDGGWTCAG
jgi:NAD(P)-dependent dehydrogenase (short-subunit alcohol dehydrogenase family)